MDMSAIAWERVFIMILNRHAFLVIFFAPLAMTLQTALVIHVPAIMEWCNQAIVASAIMGTTFQTTLQTLALNATHCALIALEYPTLNAVDAFTMQH